MSGRSAARFLAWGALLLLGATGVYGFRALAPHPPGPHPTSVLGQEVPSTTLRTASGAPVVLGSRISGPTVIYVADVGSASDCTSIPMEIRVLRRSHPGLGHLFVGVGRDTAFFASYLRQERMLPIALLDPAGELPAQLGIRPPFVLLVDAEQRIVHVDSRGGAAYSPFGTSRVLASLTTLLLQSSDSTRLNRSAAIVR